MVVSSPPIPLVLASASPARRLTLRAAGVEPIVMISSVDERAVAEAAAGTRAACAGSEPLSPRETAELLARAKAEDVASASPAPGRPESAGALVLGCDSVLELDGAIHGKPADAAEAIQRWRAMSGRSAVLHTGHWLIDNRDAGRGRAVGAVSATVVHFADLSEPEIRWYVGTGEPLQVSGAFTIDGLGGPFVRGVEGDHHGVVGLSLPLLRDLLGEFGVAWFDIVSRSAGPDQGAGAR